MVFQCCLNELSPRQRLPDSIFAYKRVGSNQWRATNKWTDPPLAGVPYSVTVGDRTTTRTPICPSAPKNLEFYFEFCLWCKILKLDSQWPRPDSMRNCDGFLLLIMHSEALYWAAVLLRVRHWQIEQVEQVMAEAKEKRELILKRLSVTPRLFQDSLAVATVTCSL